MLRIEVTPEQFNQVRTGVLRRVVRYGACYSTDVGTPMVDALIVNREIPGMTIECRVNRIVYVSCDELTTEDVQNTGYRSLGNVLDALYAEHATLQGDTVLTIYSFVRTDVGGG